MNDYANQIGCPESENWSFSLYIAGPSPKSARAVATLRTLCEEHVSGRYAIEVIDLVKQPALARSEDIFAVPVLVRNSPPPVSRFIGDLANAESMLADLLGFEPAPTTPSP